MDFTPAQSKAVTRLSHYHGGPVWARVGSGKTRIAYGIFAVTAKKYPEHPRFLVFARREAFDDWRDEMHKCKLPWVVREIESVDDVFQRRLSNKPMVYLASHGMIGKLAEGLRINGFFNAVCYDEGFLYKNPSSIHCKAANKISQATPWAIILSGSIMTARNLTDVYGQLYAINQHEVLARTKTEFNSRFMYQLQIGSKTNAWGQPIGPMVNRAGAVAEVARRIKPRSFIYFPKDNQREILEEVKLIEPTKGQIAAMQQLREMYMLQLKGRELELKNKMNLITKCQQLSDGWINMAQPTKSNPKPRPDIIAVGSSKAERLTGIVAELVACGEKVVVWVAFQYTVSLLLQYLQERLPSLGVYGMSGDREFDLAGWKKRGQVAIATEASGSSFNHFRHCAYAIYYSMDVHWLHLQQSQGRTNRHDSKHPTCYYYFLQTKRTFDSFVLRRARTSGKREAELLTQAAVTSWLRN